MKKGNVSTVSESKKIKTKIKHVLYLDRAVRSSVTCDENKNYWKKSTRQKNFKRF